jgi:hypothetical protein
MRANSCDLSLFGSNKIDIGSAGKTQATKRHHQNARTATISTEVCIANPSQPPTHTETSKILESEGAPKNRYALSEDNELDGREICLKDALETIVGRGTGTFLSSLPGKLAYF